MSKPIFSTEQWQDLIRRQATSGLTVAAFCRRARVTESSFFAWRRKLRAAPGFAEARVTDAPLRDRVPEPGGLELQLPGGRRLVVRPGFDRQTLRELLAALEAEADA